jgi:hypothetical protein
MPLKTAAIKQLLTINTRDDLAQLYNHDMEVQVNVAQDGGERIDGEYKGKKWQGWSDGLTTWKPFRIPYKANTEPEYTDTELKFDLAAHTEAIGMTGWDWKAKVSRWVAFDFDAITGHSDKHTKKLSNEELEKVKQAAISIDWVTVRKSTAGKGIHLYVFLPAVPTATHTEHAALARAILGKLSALTGYDYVSKVDTCGGNMWVWARKMKGTDGLTLIKAGTVLYDIPANWRDHVKVISGNRRKNLPQDIESAGQTDSFEELSGKQPRIPLDDDHKKLIEYLKVNNALWWWDQDNHMLVTHTIWLKKAHTDLQFKGAYDTMSQGKDLNTQNCYLYPLRKGAWTVRRFGQGVQEHDSWTQDTSGWTRCYYNREADLPTAAKSCGGLEDTKGAFQFREAEVAMKAAALLGVHINLSGHYSSRETKLKTHKDGRLQVTVERKDTDRAEDMPGWLPEKDKWIRLYTTQQVAKTEVEVGNYDDMTRHLVSGGEDAGWVIKSDCDWCAEPLAHVTKALASTGLKGEEVTGVIGSSVLRPWRLVNKPFQTEYPGDREWNRNAAQFRFAPNQDLDNLQYPTWQKILTHCGKGLDVAVAKNAWCKSAGVLTGADYLKCWVASMLREPTQPLPYLFFHSKEQNTGKSSFWESIALLLTKGYHKAEAALTSQQGFNEELHGAILCSVEEIDLKNNKIAYNRIKDWVTGRELLIHPKGGTPYHAQNTTHWVQCSNDYQSCPVFGEDTRIVSIHVEKIPLVDMIPRKAITVLLEKEAPDFLAEILNLELPVSNDRLNIPAIETEDKLLAQQMNRNEFEIFLEDQCHKCPGSRIKFSDFYNKFLEKCDPLQVSKWSKIRVSRELPHHYPHGRSRKDAQFYIGNIAFKGTECDAAPGSIYILNDSYLDLVQP